MTVWVKHLVIVIIIIIGATAHEGPKTVRQLLFVGTGSKPVTITQP